MSARYTIVLSLVLTGLFLAAVLLLGHSFAPAGTLRFAAFPAAESRVLQGADSPDEARWELLPGQKLDLNRAGREELMLLPGIGEVLADAIVADRQEKGPFSRPEEIQRVDGIGPGKYAAIADKIMVEVDG